MKQIAIIRQHQQPSRSTVHARPTLRVQNIAGEIKEYANCVEIKEGNLIRAFLPPSQSGASLTMFTNAGPDAVYKIFDWDWRVAEVKEL